ncbi:hypothetical protein EDD59_11715 [Muricomes intestini]|jgi:hypothetical protein|uniref:Uncharacterized protein n=1 Tax=Muricomes intestini TaxID=1796634 RepID=A0A4R3K3U8_9FIRM|nr:hypothetical protein EDD59_11715 [Muricomes intestini]
MMWGSKGHAFPCKHETHGLLTPVSYNVTVTIQEGRNIWENILEQTVLEAKQMWY